MKKIVYTVDFPPYKNRCIAVVFSPENPVTFCEICYCDVDERGRAHIAEVAARGWSVCRPNDTWDLQTGCRQALTSALRIEYFSDEYGERIWEGFGSPTLFKPKPKPKRPTKRLTSEYCNIEVVGDDGKLVFDIPGSTSWKAGDTYTVDIRIRQKNG